MFSEREIYLPILKFINKISGLLVGGNHVKCHIEMRGKLMNQLMSEFDGERLKKFW